MHKKWKGYFTVEAAFVMPIVLFLYLLIILAALFLYCRCAISQDNFLIGMRAGSFSFGEEGYGEVIYGKAEKDLWSPEEYVNERLLYKRAFYPFFPTETGTYKETDGKVMIETGQKGSQVLITKSLQKINPVKMIREGRKIQNV